MKSVASAAVLLPILLLLLLSTTNLLNAARTTTNDIFINQCSMQCDSTYSTDKAFDIGMTHVYSYSGRSQFETETGNYQTTGLNMQAKVFITAKSACELKMRLSDVVINDQFTEGMKESPKSSEIKTMLEKDVIYFTRTNRQVKSVCSVKDEPQWITNIKKAIIDQIANRRTNGKVETVHGSCKVRSIWTRKYQAVSFNVKDCSNFRTSIMSDIMQLGLLDTSTVSCNYYRDTNGQLTDANCDETYKVRPIKSNENKINLRITTTTKLIKKERILDRTRFSKSTIKSTILQQFDENDRKYTENETEETLKQLCQQKEQSKVPTLFITLVKQIKSLDSKDVKKLYDRVMQSKICSKTTEIKSILFDAIAYSQSPSTINTMVTMIKANQISEADQTVWFTGLILSDQTITEESLLAIDSLIKLEQPNPQLFLGIGSLINRFCQRDDTRSCRKSKAVQNIMGKFMGVLTENCNGVNLNDESIISKMLLSLRVIGNTKYFDGKVEKTLKECALTTKNPINVRISAIETIKNMECSYDRTTMLRLLETNTEDSELRINAYLALIKCADANIMFEISDMLKKEKVNQVGSFIWTHLTNLKDTSDKLKMEIKALLQNTELKREFDLSKLKYSRNVERTIKGSLGQLTVDSNVIFSEKSFVPRSVSVDTTATILNIPKKLVEVSGRFEGIDELLFKLLGPDGYLKNNEKDKTKAAQNNVEMIKLLNALSGSVDMKLFGEQIQFVQMAKGTLGSMKKYNIIEEIMNLGRMKTFNVNKRMMLTDRSISFATTMGIPLKFNLQGSAAVNSKINSKFDVAGMTKWPISLDIKSYIKPAIAAVLQADMSLETPFTKYGMGLNFLSSTDTEIKTKLTASGPDNFQMKVELPKEQQEIVNVNGGAYVMYQDQPYRQLESSMSTLKMCTGKELIRVTGLKLCSQLSYVNDKDVKKSALGPFGPFSAKVTLDNIDAPEGYVLIGKTKINEDGDAKKLYATYIFDTPNSKEYYRQFKGMLVMDNIKKVIQFNLRSPWTDILVDANYDLLNEREKKLGVIVKYNKKTWMKVMFEHVKIARKYGEVIKGGYEIYVIGLNPIKANYMLKKYESKHQFSFRSSGLFKKPTSLNLTIKKTRTRRLSLFNKYIVLGKYKTVLGNGVVKGFASENYLGHRWDIKLIHGDGKDAKFKVVFRHKTENESTKNLLKYKLTSSISYGKFVENFFKWKSVSELSDSNVRLFVYSKYGKTGAGNSKKYSQEMKSDFFASTSERNGVLMSEGNWDLSIPKYDIKYHGIFNMKLGKNLLRSVLKLDRQNVPLVNFELKYEQPRRYLKDTDLLVKIILPKYIGKLDWKLQEVDVKKYKYQLGLTYNNDEMKISGTQTQLSALNHKTDVTINLPNFINKAKTVDLNLDINLMDFKDAKIIGKLNVPGTDYSYALNTQFSFNPENFLQRVSKQYNADNDDNVQSASVLSYEVNINNKLYSLGTTMTFICNPEEFRMQKSLVWNEDKDQMFEIDIHAKHDSPNMKQINNLAIFSIKYPGNRHAVKLRSEFKFTSLQANLEIIWDKVKRISINTMYELDDSWTQKGITASLTVKTPFPGYQLTHIGINAAGQLRHRKLDIKIQYGNNQVIFFNIILQPRSSTDFTVSSKLVTPFKRMNLVKVIIKHMYSSNSMATEASIEVGANNKYFVKFEAINNSDLNKIDVKANLNIDGNGLIPVVKVTASHKSDDIRYDTVADIKWDFDNFIKLTSALSFNNKEQELLSNGNIELLSSIYELRQMKIKWGFEHRKGIYLTNGDLSYNNDNILQFSAGGYYEWIEQQQQRSGLKGDLKGHIRILTRDAMKLKGYVNIKPTLWTTTLTVKSGDELVYYHNANFKLREFQKVFIKVPKLEFKTIDYFQMVKRSENEMVKKVWIKLGDEYLINKKVVVKVQNREGRRVKVTARTTVYKTYGQNYYFKSFVTVDYSPKRITVAGNLENSLDNKEIMRLKIDINPKREDFQEFYVKVNLNTMFDQLKSLKGSVYHRNFVNDVKPFTNKVKLAINGDKKFENFVKISGLNFIELKTSYDQLFIDFKHQIERMGFVEKFATNLFTSKQIKFVASAEIRGGSAYQAELLTSLDYLNKIAINGRFSQSGAAEFNLNYEYRQDLIKMSFIKKSNEFSFMVKSKYSLNMEISAKAGKLLNVELAYQPIFSAGWNFKLDRKAVAINSKLYVTYRESKFRLENKIERVSWRYLLIESSIDTNLMNPGQYKVGIEYRIRPSNFELDLKAFVNEDYVKLLTSLQKGKIKVIKVKLDSSFEALKAFKFEVRHKCNMKKLDIDQKYSAVLKSYDNNFVFTKLIQIVGWQFVNLKAELEMTSPRLKQYSVQPKLFRLLHKYQNDKLTELFELKIADDKAGKFELVVPMKLKSNIVMTINTPATKLVELKSNIDLEKKWEKSIQMSVANKDKMLFEFLLNANLKDSVKTVSNKLEIVDYFQNELTAKFKYPIDSKLMIAVEITNSQLKNSINFKIENDKFNKGFLSVSGLTVDEMKAEWNVRSEKFKLKGQWSDTDFVVLQAVLKGRKNFMMSVEYNKNLYKIETKKTSQERSIVGNWNEHFLSIKLKNKPRILMIDASIKSVSFSVSTIVNSNGALITGKSNIENWKNFETKVSVRKQKNEIIVNLMCNKEGVEWINFDMRADNMNYLNLLLKTGWSKLKLVSLMIEAKDLPEKFSFNFKYQPIDNSKQIVARITLADLLINGELITPVKGLRKVEINGKLDQTAREGEISIASQDWKDSISGKYRMKTENEKTTAILELMKDGEKQQIVVSLDQSKERPSIEIKVNNERIFKLILMLKAIYGAEIELALPKLLKEVQLKYTLNLDIDGPVKKLTWSGKSNIIDIPSLTISVEPKSNRYSLKLSNPPVNSRLEINVDRSNPNRRIMIVEAKYNDDQQKVIAQISRDRSRKWQKFEASLEVTGTVVNGGVQYKHEIDFPAVLKQQFEIIIGNNKFVRLENEWNKKDNDFSLISKAQITPKNKEFKGEFLLFKKESEIELVLKADNLLTEDIKVKMLGNEQTKQLLITSPINMIRSVEIKFVSTYEQAEVTKQLLIDTNVLGKFESTLIGKFPNRNSMKWMFQLNTPKMDKWCSLTLSTELKGKAKKLTISTTFQLKEAVYQLNIERDVRQLKFNLETPHLTVQKVNVMINKNNDGCQTKIKYNDYELEVRKVLTKNRMSIAVNSNIEKIKQISGSIQRTSSDRDMQMVNLNFEYLNEAVSAKIVINKQKRSMEFQMKNSLVWYIPKSMNGQITNNAIQKLAKLVINDKSIIDSYYQKGKMSLLLNIFEFSLQLTADPMNLKLTVINKQTYEIEIKRMSNNQLDVIVSVNGDRYTLKTSAVNNRKQYLWLLSTDKNSIDKYLEISFGFLKNGQSVEWEIMYNRNKVSQLKYLVQQENYRRKHLVDFSVLGYGTVVDFIYDSQPNELNCKFSWKLLRDFVDVYRGSVLLARKSSQPVSYAISVSLPQGNYRAQYITLDSGERRISVTSPFKGSDVLISLKHEFDRANNEFSCLCSFENDVLGKYNVKGLAKNMGQHDPLVKFIFSTTENIVSLVSQIKSSEPNLFRWNTDIKLFDWDSIKLELKLSTKEMYELKMALTTPYRHLKMLQLEKSLRYNSIGDHSSKIQLTYMGETKIVTSAQHRFDLTKKIFRLSSKYEVADVELVSVTVDHKGDHNDLQHLVLWKVKSRKYGYLLDGKMRPLFRGRTEIYTPNHRLGKIVLVAEQQKSGFLMETTDGDGAKGEFKYNNNNKEEDDDDQTDSRSFKLQLPTDRVKPIELKYKMKRSILSGVMKTEVRYGNKQLIDLFSKVEMDKNKYIGKFNVKAPLLTDKSAELSVNHQKNGDEGVTFDHYLKLDNDAEQLYRLFGKIYRKSLFNFNSDLTVDMPLSGKLSMAIKQEVNGNRHNRHWRVTHNEVDVIKYNEEMMIDRNQNEYSGDWKLETRTQTIRTTGSLKNSKIGSKGEAKIMYNNLPILQLAVDSESDNKYQLQMKIASDSKLTLNVDKKLNWLDVALLKSDQEYQVYVSTKKEEFTVKISKNGNLYGGLWLKYGQQAYTGKLVWNEKKYVAINLLPNKDRVNFKVTSSFKQLSQLIISVTKWQIKVGAIRFDKSYDIDGSYEYRKLEQNVRMIVNVKLPNKNHVVRFTSNEKEVEIKYNEYYIKINYVIAKNSWLLKMNNNLFAVKSIESELQLSWPKLMKLRLDVDGKEEIITVEKSNDALKAVLMSSYVDKYYSVNQVELMAKKVINKSEKRWLVSATINKKKEVSLQALVKNGVYSVGLESNLKTTAAFSIDTNRKEIVIGLRRNQWFFNVISTMSMVNNADNFAINIQTDVQEKFYGQLKWTFKMTNNKKEKQLIADAVYHSYKVGINALLIPNQRVRLTGWLGDKNYVIRLNKMGQDQYQIIVDKDKREIGKFDLTINDSLLKANLMVDNRELVNVKLSRKEYVYLLSLRYRQMDLLLVSFTVMPHTGVYVYELSVPQRQRIELLNRLDKYGTRQILCQIKGNFFYYRDIDSSAGVSFRNKNNKKFIQLTIANVKHEIYYEQTRQLTDNSLLGVKGILINKLYGKKWALGFEKSSGNWQLELTAPGSEKRTIKYQVERQKGTNQMLKLNLEFFDIVQLKMKRDGSDKYSGYVKVYDIKLASVTKQANSIEITLKRSDDNNKAIFVKWSKTERGLWMKNYQFYSELEIKQLSMNINAKLINKLESTKYTYKRAVECNYRTFEGVDKKWNLLFEVDRSVENQLVVKLDNPILPVKFLAERKQETGASLTYNLGLYFPEQRRVSASLELVPSGELMGVTGRINYNPELINDYLEMHVKYLNKRQFSISVFDSKENGKLLTKYLQFQVTLLNRKKIGTLVTQEGIFSRDVSRYLYFARVKSRRYVSKYMSQSFDLVTDDISKRFERVKKTLVNSEEIINRIKLFISKFADQVSEIDKEIQMMIRKNEFYVRSISRTVSRILMDVLFGLEMRIRRVYRDLEYFVINIQRTYYYSVENLLYKQKVIEDWLNRQFYIVKVELGLQIQKYLPKIADSLSQSIAGSNAALMKTFNKFTKYCYMFKYYFRTAVAKNIYVVTTKLIKLVKYLAESPVTKLVQYLKDNQKIDKAIAKLITSLESMAERMQNLVDKFSRTDLNLQLEKAIGKSYFGKFKSLIKSGTNILIEQLKDGENLKMIENYLINKVDNKLKRIATQINDNVMSLTMTKFIDVVSLKQNRKGWAVEVNYFVPLPMRDLQSLPDFKYVNRKIARLTEIVNYFKKMGQQNVKAANKLRQLADWFIPSTPTLSFSIMPEFQSYATVSVDTVVTFDKKTYQLVSKPCQVLLAKDLLYKKWQITMEQLNKAKGKLYKIKIDNKILTVPSNGENLRLNDKAVDLPLIIGNTKVWSMGKIVNVKNEKYGLTITLDGENDILTVGIFGWYHDKLRGLLGNADNEPFNDLMLEDGKVVSLDKFLAKFNENGVTCKVITAEKNKKTAAKSSSNKSDKKYCPVIRKVVCKFLFYCPMSPMQACFSKVNPDSFYKMCISSSEEFDFSRDRSICRAARNYQSQCKKMNVPVPLPYPCRRCSVQTSNKDIPIESSVKLRMSEKVADIIVIVEEGKCLNSIKNNLQKFMDQLDKTMTSKSISNVRYGLISTGNSYFSSAHTHTVGQKLFGNREEIMNAISSLNTNSESGYDTEKGLQLAEKYPYREYASRHVIFVGCGKENRNLDTIKSIFAKKSIFFNYLTPFQFTLKSKNQKVIYGVDKEKMYSAVIRNGESRNRYDVQVPTSDSLYQFATNANGVVFNLEFMMPDSKSDISRNRFISNLADQISRRATPIRTTVCTCMDEQDLVCRPKELHTIYPAKKAE